MKSDIKILLVDDDIDIIEFLSYNLKNEGYTIDTAFNGIEAIKKAQLFNPDLIIMDIMMPEMDGIEACEEIRKIETLENSIITFLTARDEDYSKIAGLTAGADDYITKPIKPKVLSLKVKSLLRRLYSENKLDSLEVVKPKLKAGNIIIDKEKYIIFKDNKEYILPRKQFELIELLASKPDNVFTREDIFSRIWGDDTFVSDRTIDVHIRRIRTKLGNDIIKTVKGVGYKFVS